MDDRRLAEIEAAFTHNTRLGGPLEEDQNTIRELADEVRRLKAFVVQFEAANEAQAEQLGQAYDWQQATELERDEARLIAISLLPEEWRTISPEEYLENIRKVYGWKDDIKATSRRADETNGEYVEYVDYVEYVEYVDPIVLRAISTGLAQSARGETVSLDMSTLAPDDDEEI